jgi:hypothetical protein
MIDFRSFAAVTILPAILTAVIFTGVINALAEPAATSPPGGNTKAGVWDDSVKPVDPGQNAKSGVFDDSIRPVDPAGIAGKGGTFDDSVKPVDPGQNAKSGEWDDSVRPNDPAGIAGKGGTWDDSIKPVDPGKPPKAIKGTEAGATAIEYGKTAEPDAKKPDEK